jgi:hypothetical protein
MPGTSLPTAPTPTSPAPAPDGSNDQVRLNIDADVNALLNRFGGSEAMLFAFLDKLYARYK